MNEVLYLGDIPYESDLEHYGVAGMKWGVHKARGIIGKMDKMTRKADKLAYESAKIEYKKGSTFNRKKREKLEDKYLKTKYDEAKIRKKIAKGKNYVNKVNTKISKISKEDLDTGYKFCQEYMGEFEKYKMSFL